MSLESVTREGSILIRGTDDCNLDPIGFSFAKTGARSCFLTNQSSKDFARRLNVSLDSCTFIPLNSSSTKQYIINECRGFSLCVIDSIDFLIDHLGLDQTIALLHEMKGSSCVVALCPASSVDITEWKRLQFVSDAYFVISIVRSRCFSDSVVFKRNGKTIRMKEIVTFNPDFKLTSTKYVPTMDDKTSGPKTPEDGLSTPFDMGFTLKESEKNARAALELPYMSAANQEGLVGLRLSEKKVRVGGQVIYTPDDGDDLDDSDPDDDLNL